MRDSTALVRYGALAAVALALHAAPAQAQLSHRQLSAALTTLARQAPNQTELVTIATSPGGRSIQALRVGAPDRPALLVVANAFGPQLIGSEIALEAARSFLSGSRAGLMDSTTIWIIPRLNPDAAEAALNSLSAGRTANDGDVDNDHDMAMDEDPVDDLNGDGLITQLRLVDPNGAWIADPDDPRLLRRADATKGEVGMYSVESEGSDNDGDGSYNEDGPGAVDINRNFSFEYPAHGNEAGLYPFSAPETRGFAEFVFVHDEIAAVYVIGPQDNLMKPWTNGPNQGIMNEAGKRAQEGTSAGGPLHSIMRADQSTYADLSRRFKEVTNLDREPDAAGPGGDLLSWSYYHFGRWAAGSRGWWVPEAPKDTTTKAKTGGRSTSSGKDPIANERNALKWFDSQGINAFVPWAPVSLGGDETRSAEVGGMNQAMLLNPPVGAEHDSTLARQARFIADFAMMLPRIALRNVSAKSLGGGVYRIEVEVANLGALPTHTSLAARLRQPRRVRLDLEIPEGATILSGDAIQLLPAIGGGGRSRKIAWTIAARTGNSISIRAGAPATGSATQTLTLR